MACCELAGTSAFFTPGLRLVYAALTEAQLHEAHTGRGRALAGGRGSGSMPTARSDMGQNSVAQLPAGLQAALRRRLELCP
jgi:hypothetical protein